jgi:hypothetical protein
MELAVERRFQLVVDSAGRNLVDEFMPMFHQGTVVGRFLAMYRMSAASLALLISSRYGFKSEVIAAIPASRMALRLISSANRSRLNPLGTGPRLKSARNQAECSVLGTGCFDGPHDESLAHARVSGCHDEGVDDAGIGAPERGVAGD